MKIRLYRAVVIVFLLFFTFQVLSSENSMGYIILDNHNSALLKFDLNSYQIEKFLDIPINKGLKGRYVNMDKVGDDGFLFENNQREIGYYQIKNKKTKILYRNSKCPIYFDDNKSILFNKKEKTSDGFKGYMCLGGLDGEECMKLREIGLGDSAICPVKINKNEAIVVTSENFNKSNFEIFNIKDFSFKPTFFEDCIPKFSLSDGGVLCKDNDKYFISDKFGKRKKNVPVELVNSYDMLPQAYFKEINSILIYEFRERVLRKNVYNLWLLNMDTLDKSLLIKGTGTTNKGAIYISN